MWTSSVNFLSLFKRYFGCSNPIWRLNDASLVPPFLEACFWKDDKKSINDYCDEEKYTDTYKILYIYIENNKDNQEPDINY